VEFTDGSVLAQLSPPDMCLPISTHERTPNRVPGPARAELDELRSLNFQQPDRETFPALQLGYEVAKRGGTCGAVLNAANEAAVDAFLKRELSFLDIPRVCREVLDSHHYSERPTLSELTLWTGGLARRSLRWRTRRRAGPDSIKPGEPPIKPDAASNGALRRRRTAGAAPGYDDDEAQPSS